MEESIEYSWPIIPKYKVCEHDKYGIRQNHYALFKQRAHSGFDITADYGTEVKSMASGLVLCVGFDGTTLEGIENFNTGYGNRIEILNDDGRRCVYGHLSEIFVKQGDRVDNTTIIGKTGCSGGSRVPHLHIEIRKTNTEQTGLDYTLNPLEVLPKIDLDKLDLKFTTEPYAKLWSKMASDTNPWGFSEDDIWYKNDRQYIR
ncbi:MAG: M23 family metallopeptidase [Clostridia bacterium]|nr:M23 family metallopeptidase [Clostridia bacterium]